MYITIYGHKIGGQAYEPSPFKRGVQEILPRAAFENKRHVLRCCAWKYRLNEYTHPLCRLLGISLSLHFVLGGITGMEWKIITMAAK
jgi:hypothetical protein